MGKFDYINWLKQATIKKVSQDELKNMYNLCVEKGEKAASKTKINDWLKNYTYFLDKKGKYINLYTSIDDNFYIYTTNSIDSAKNGKSGTDAIKLFVEKFAELNNLNKAKALYMAYGTTDEKIKYCVPKQFYYIKKEMQGKIIPHVSAIDATAHYPSNACGLLPDSKTAKICATRIKPSAEYPFAFYIVSGHVAEYNRFDTHDWIRSPFMLSLFDNEHLNSINTSEKDEITVLMKASAITMDSTWDFFFKKRKENPDYKVVMNATIGNFHRQKYNTYMYAHLAAIIIGRANDKQLKMMEQIGTFKILHTCVDGIIYRGTERLGIDEKIMGTYQQEFLDCDFKMNGTNIYMAMKNNQLIKYKHGAFNRIKDTNELIDECAPNSFDDMDKWIRIDDLKEVKELV